MTAAAHTTDSKLSTRALAIRWLCCAGAVAVLFAIFLVKMDTLLSTSDREAKVGKRLNEIRTAQTIQPAGSIDPRILNSTSLSGSSATEANGSAD